MGGYDPPLIAWGLAGGVAFGLQATSAWLTRAHLVEASDGPEAASDGPEPSEVVPGRVPA